MSTAARIHQLDNRLNEITPGIRSMGLDVGATKINTKIPVNTSSIELVTSFVESFETLSGWTLSAGGGNTITADSTWATLGTNSMAFTFTVPNTPYAERQFDLTNASVIKIDHRQNIGGYPPNSCTLSINGTVVHNFSTSNGIYLDRTIDVSAYSGICTIRLSVNNGNGTGKVYFDNLRIGVNQEAGYLLKSLTRLNLDRITFPKIYKPANTKCQVDICGAEIAKFQVASVAGNVATLKSGTVVEESFEAFDGTQTTGWTKGGAGTLSRVTTPGVTHGTYAVKYLGGGTAGNLEQSKTVNLSGVSHILLDYYAATTNGDRVYVLIDGVQLYDGGNMSTNTQYTDKSIDVSAYNGNHTLTLRVFCNAGGTNTILDNLRFVYAAPSGIDDAYNGKKVAIKSGAGAGQVTDVVDYVGSSKQITLPTLTTAVAVGSEIVLYEPIVSDISPGFDFSTIDYTVYPTVNVLCSLERLTGATASPSMGVPIVTSIEKDWVSQAPVSALTNTVTNVTAFQSTGRVRLDGISARSSVGSGAAVYATITVDGVVIFNDIKILEASGTSGSGVASNYVPLNLIATNTIDVLFRSGISTPASVTVAYSR